MARFLHAEKVKFGGFRQLTFFNILDRVADSGQVEKEWRERYTPDVIIGHAVGIADRQKDVEHPRG